MKIPFTPIVISTFRESFAALQVGDQVLDRVGDWNTRWEALTVTKVTPTQFITSSRRFKRTDGYEIGPGYRRATLPTPELVARINVDSEAYAVRRELGRVDWAGLPLSVARQVLALLPEKEA